MTYKLSSTGIQSLRSAAEEHGAGEADLAAIDRLEQGTGEDVDIDRLMPLAKLADLPWQKLFFGDVAPRFECTVCNKPMGASRLSASHPWIPGPCHWCARKRRAKEAAQRRRESPRALAGVDIDEAVEDLRTLPVFADLPRRIKVDVGHTATGNCGGRAFIRKHPKMRVYGGPTSTPERVLEVVLHELCHLALPRGTHHGERFRRFFARAVREAWGIEVSVDVDREHHSNASYKMGEIVIARLRELIAEGSIKTYPPEPVPPKLPRVERLAELVERRAAHAERMLAKAERRMKLAKTSYTKWHAKVSYYEKQAAKRSGK